MNEKLRQRIGIIGNYYGDLFVKERNGRFFWGIEDHSGTQWEEIDKTLYRELLKHNKRPELSEEAQSLLYEDH